MRRLVLTFAAAATFAAFVPVAAQERPAQAPALDAAARTAVIDALIRELDRAYVFPQIGAAMGDLRARVERSEYDAIEDRDAFAHTLTERLQAVSKDKHLRVRVGGPRPGGGAPVGVRRPDPSNAFGRAERRSPSTC